MAADKDEHFVDISYSREDTLMRFTPGQPITVDGRETIVRGVQLLGQQVALCQSLDAVEGNARQEWDVFEAGKQIDRA